MNFRNNYIFDNRMFSVYRNYKLYIGVLLVLYWNLVILEMYIGV